MNVKDHLVRTKAYPAVIAKVSFEDSECTILGIAVADGSKNMKMNLWFGVEDAIELLLNLKFFICLSFKSLTRGKLGFFS